MQLSKHKHKSTYILYLTPNGTHVCDPQQLMSESKANIVQ